MPILAPYSAGKDQQEEQPQLDSFGDPKVLLQPYDPQTADTSEVDDMLELSDMQGPVPERAKQLNKTGILNLAMGTGDAILGVLNAFIVNPFVQAGTLGASFFPNDNKDFVDRYMSLQAKMAARDGVYRFLTYEPVTDLGEEHFSTLMTPFNWISKQTESLGSAMADVADGGLNEIEMAIRAEGSKKRGGWTAEDELKLAEARADAGGVIGAVLRTSPDAALLSLPTIWGMRRTAAIKEKVTQANKVFDALEPKRVAMADIQKLEGYNAEAITAEEAAVLTEAMKNGQLSKDISIETFQGKPTKILTGADTIRAMQMLQDKGIRMTAVKARLVERDSFSPQEIAVLSILAESGFRDIVKNSAKLEEIEGMRGLSAREKFTSMVLDSSGNIKRQLLKEAGPAGEQAVQAFELVYGATPRAQLIFQDMKKAVWGKRGRDDPALSHDKRFEIKGAGKQRFSEHDLFDFFAHAKRVQEIVRYKPGAIRKKPVTGPDGKPLVDEQGRPVFERVPGKLTLSGPINPDNASGVLFEIKRQIGAKRYQQFEERLTSLHDTMHMVLDRALEGGLITTEAYNKMKGLNYLTRSFVSEIDPLRPNVKGQKVQARESGIPFLEGGTKKFAFQTDVETVTMEHIVRMERRLARNSATQRLAAVADTVDFVKKPTKEGAKTPEGYTEITYFEDGVKKSLWMEDRMAVEWVTGDLGMSVGVASTLRMLSGSSLVKALATGYNPEFAVRNFTRDLQHVWRATGTEYSTFLPLYLGQIFGDIVKVSGDVWNKKGVYRDYIMEGGGFEMLTHQGRNVLLKTDEASSLYQQLGAGKGKWGERYNFMKEQLSRVNEFSELVTRLAIRNRIIENQRARGLPIDSPKATWLARRYIDFSQGGTLTKAIDTTIPYLNANIQALRTGLRPYAQGKKMVGVTLLKDLQLVGLKAALQGRYWQTDPEQMRTIPEEVLLSNFIIPTGMWITDDDGSRKPLLLRFPLDSTVVPLTGPIDLLIKKDATGENPDVNLLALLQASNPVQIGVMPPTMEAIYGAASNYNFYTNDKIWKGEAVLPGYEYTSKTPEVLRMLGELAPGSISPTRVHHAIKTLAPTNTYIYSAEFMSNLLLGSVDPIEDEQRIKDWQDNTTARMMKEFPGLRTMVTVGQPAEAMTQIERQALLEANSQMKVMRDDVDRVVRAFSVYPAGDPRQRAAYNNLLTKVATNYTDRPDMFNLATETFKNKLAVDIIWNKVVPKDTVYFPTKDSWIHMGTMTPENRGKVFYWAWRNKDAEGRKKMFEIAGAIDSVGGNGGFLSSRFMASFQREKTRYGEELPLNLGE